MKQKSSLQLSSVAMALLTLSACTGKISSSSSSSPEPALANEKEPISAEAPTEVQRKAQLATVRCPDGATSEECPASVAMLVTTHGTTSQTCTAFLISDDTLVTRSNCLPPELNAGSDCSGRIWALFPATTDHPQAVQSQCARVLTRAESGATSSEPDHAFLKLKDPVARDTLRLSSQGLENEARFRVITLEAERETERLSGTLRAVDCQAIQHSHALPSFVEAQSPEILLADCDLSDSSAGAPILTTDGSVVGLIRGPLDGLAVLNASSPSAPKVLEGRIAELSTGTNFACVSDPTTPLKLAIPKACTAVPAAAPQGTLNAELEKQVLENTDGTARGKLRWKATLTATPGSEDAQTLAPMPRCFEKPASGWLEAHRKQFLGWAVGGYRESDEIRLQLSFRQVKLGLDSTLRPVYRDLSEQEPPRLLPVTITFSPKKIAEKGESEFTVKGRDLDTGKDRILFQETLKACADAT